MSDANGTVNDKGVQYYKNLIAALKAVNIEPMVYYKQIFDWPGLSNRIWLLWRQVTLYHWDLPQYYGDLDGFQNASMADWFEMYADLCYREFGADVKYWITFNEPWCVSYLGYGNGEQAPGGKNSGTDDYVAGHNLLRAHARAYRLYETKYNSTQKG